MRQAGIANLRHEEIEAEKLGVLHWCLGYQSNDSGGCDIIFFRHCIHCIHDFSAELSS
jgi:hypothetical protein